jgi:cytochrome c oxidase subunit 3/cytochrome o ubiquinol oxidase subunit 3
VSDAIAASAGSVPAVHDDHHYTSTGQNSRKVLFWTFIGSECMFFGSLIATYMIYKGKDKIGPHPHEILNIPLTSVSAFVLLMSSLTMVLALSGIQQRNMGKARLWLAATATLGMSFVGFQIYEFNHFMHEGLLLSTNLFGSTFYVLTGFHGTHVAVGVIWLWTLFILTFTGRIGPKNDLDVEICGLYWHFVDVVWIAIFTLIYLLQ